MSVALVSDDRCLRGAKVVVTDLSTDDQKEGYRPNLLRPVLSKLCCFDLDSGTPIVFGEVIRYEGGTQIEEIGYSRQSAPFGTNLPAHQFSTVHDLWAMDFSPRHQLDLVLVAERN